MNVLVTGANGQLGNEMRIVANRSQNDYYFFVADKNNNVYFSKTIEEHQEIINKLINEGLWYTY